MQLRVLLDGNWLEEDIRVMKGLLDEGIDLANDPGSLEYDVLVSGRPDRILLDGSPRLRYLLIPFAGLPASTRETMREYPGISVHNIHHNASSAAELALGLVIAAARRIVSADRKLRVGDWSPRYSQSDCLLIEGSSSLILGYGTLGGHLGRILSVMGSRVRGIRRSISVPQEIPGAVIYPSDHLHRLLPDTDILVLTLPLTDETRCIIGERELSMMHGRSILVNVGRAALVDEDALFQSLDTGRIGAAGIDVWYSYPESEKGRTSTCPSKLDFGSLENVVMTPHIGGAFGSPMLERLRIQSLAQSLNTLVKTGKLPCRVDLDLGY